MFSDIRLFFIVLASTGVLFSSGADDTTMSASDSTAPVESNGTDSVAAGGRATPDSSDLHHTTAGTDTTHDLQEDTSRTETALQDTSSSSSRKIIKRPQPPAFLIQTNNDTLVLIKKRETVSGAESQSDSSVSAAASREDCYRDCYNNCYKQCLKQCEKQDEECFDDCDDDCDDECDERCDDEKTIDISSIIDRSSRTIAKSRQQGYGGGGGWSPGIMAIDMEPVAELVGSDNVLGRKAFPDLHEAYTPIMMSGWMGYGGLGNGTRIGGGAWDGNIHFSSKPYDAPDETDPRRKEIAVVEVEYSFVGFLMEKSFVRDQFNYLAGGMISLGSIEVKRDFFTSDSPSAFKDVWEDMDDEETAEASLVGIELHGGFTYTVLPWIHLGADVNAHVSFSINGFGAPGLNSFVMASPGMRLRIVFGNIG